jgi:dienelactone hydrolase
LSHTKIRYSDGVTSFTGTLVRPDVGASCRPGILVIHGGAGLDAHAEGRADRFARLGFTAFACDMYGDGVGADRQRILARIATLRNDRAALLACANAAMDVLRSAQEDRRIAAVGYCFGGLAALELARAGADLEAVVSVHGSLSTTWLARPGEVSARILVCHGALDPYSPPAHVAAFIEEMNGAGADWRLVAYGGAMHGFTHERATGQTAGVKYDARADEQASAAIQAFLEDTFRPAGSS